MKEYLGDGVSVQMIGEDVVLSTDKTMCVSHEIWLFPDIRRKLLDYISRNVTEVETANE